MHRLLVIFFIFIVGLIGFFKNPNIGKENLEIRKEKNEITAVLRNFKKEDVLDPSHLRFIQEYFYLDNLSIRLLSLNEKGEYELQLAKEIKFSNNKKNIFITINKYFFSDGSPITIKDVYYSFMRSITLGVPHSKPSQYIKGAKKAKDLDDQIEGLEIIAEDQIRISLNYPMKELFYFLQLTDFSIYHSSQYKKKKLYVKDWAQVTSGAYRIAFKGNKTYFIANKKFYGYSDKIPHQINIRPIDDEINYCNTLKNGEADIGYLNFLDYKNNFQCLHNQSDYQYFGSPYGGIVTLILNVKNKKFRKKENRQWVLKKVLESFKIDEKDKGYMRKANQFFIPGSLGYLKNKEIKNILNKIDIKNIPSDLKDGVTIKSIQGMNFYVNDKLKLKLSRVLGIPLEMHLDVLNKEYISFLDERDFEVSIMATSMSYKVLSETLNLTYLSEKPLLLDPSDKIKEIINLYQKTEKTDEESHYIHQLLEQMTEDAESIPLFYYTSPIFVNINKLDVSGMNLDETLPFWRFHV